MGTFVLAFLAALVIGIIVAGYAHAQAPHKTTLNWLASTGATGYNVYMTLGPCTGTFNKLNTTPITLLTFVDTGQTDGEVRCYRVTALNSTSESDPTGTSLAVTPTNTAGPVRLLPPGGFSTGAQ